MSEKAEPPAGPEDNFVRNLKRLREQRGMSQEAVAAAMTDAGYPYHQATVYKIETGNRRVQLAEATALAGILGTSVARMVEPEHKTTLGDVVKESWYAVVDQARELHKSVDEYNARRAKLKEWLEREYGESQDQWRSRLVGEIGDDAFLESIRQAAETSATAVVEAHEASQRLFDMYADEMKQLTIKQRRQIAEWELERARAVHHESSKRIEDAEFTLSAIDGEEKG